MEQSLTNWQEKYPKGCSPGFRYVPANQTGQPYLHRINCKRRMCDECGKFWAFKWRSALKEKCEYAGAMALPEPSRALTTTFACNPPAIVVKAVLRYFWQLVRKVYPTVTYFGAVEFNQLHTVPHIHFVLSGDEFMPQPFLVECWIKAQEWAGLEKIAFNLRIERIRKNVMAYYTKYVTKLTGAKDEVPRRENWSGRFVRYSVPCYKKDGTLHRAGFFPAPIPVMADYARFKRALESDESLERAKYYVRKPLQGLEAFMIAADNEQSSLNQLLLREWDYQSDRGRASPLEPDGQLTMFHV